MDENSSSKRSKKEKKAKKEKKEKKPSLVRQTSGFLKKQIVDLKEAVADTADLLKKPSSARQLPPPLRLPPESPSSSSRSPPTPVPPSPPVTPSFAKIVPFTPRAPDQEEDPSSTSSSVGAAPKGAKEQLDLRFSRREINAEKCSLPINSECDYTIKLVLIGTSGVGKTSLLKRLCDNDFDPNLKSTIGVEFRSYMYETLGGKKSIKVNIWDTAGAEKFRAITKTYYRGAVGIVAVYDITKDDSYDAIVKEDTGYIAEAQDSCNHSNEPLDQPMVMIIGNKIDVPKKRCVPSEDVERFCKGHNFAYFEVSAKTHVNVNRAFQEFIEAIYEQRLKPQTKVFDRRPRSSSIILPKPPPPALDPVVFSPAASVAVHSEPISVPPPSRSCAC